MPDDDERKNDTAEEALDVAAAKDEGELKTEPWASVYTWLSLPCPDAHLLHASKQLAAIV